MRRNAGWASADLAVASVIGAHTDQQLGSGPLLAGDVNGDGRARTGGLSPDKRALSH